MLVGAINDHKHIVTSYGATLSSRMAKKAAEKRARRELPLPAPFYAVDLRDEFIAPPRHKTNTSSGRPVEWSHRWDVRGHECVRVERGQLPVNPKEVEKLQKRGYRNYEGMTLEAGDGARLLRAARAARFGDGLECLRTGAIVREKEDLSLPHAPAARVEASKNMKTEPQNEERITRR